MSDFLSSHTSLVLLVVWFLSLNSALNLTNKVRVARQSPPSPPRPPRPDTCAPRAAAHLHAAPPPPPARRRPPTPPPPAAPQWALAHYGLVYPLILTSCHMAFSFLVLAPFALRTPLDVHARFLRKQWRGVAFIGAFLAVNIGLNNISLLGITLSLNQVIRSAIPVVTCALAVVVEGVRPSGEEAGALVVLSAGVMIAMWQGAVGGSPGSILCCVAGTISNGAMMTFSSRLLSASRWRSSSRGRSTPPGAVSTRSTTTTAGWCAPRCATAGRSRPRAAPRGRARCAS
jgi:hypothetical protein